MINVCHALDIFSNNDKMDFGIGLMVKVITTNDYSRYFVTWPKSTNKIIGGWYSSDNIIILG